MSVEDGFQLRDATRRVIERGKVWPLAGEHDGPVPERRGLRRECRQVEHGLAPQAAVADREQAGRHIGVVGVGLSFPRSAWEREVKGYASSSFTTRPGWWSVSVNS